MNEFKGLSESMGNAEFIQPVLFLQEQECPVMYFCTVRELNKYWKEWAVTDFSASVALEMCFHIMELDSSAQSRIIISSLS